MCFFCVMLCSCQYWWCYLYVDFCLYYVSVLLLLIWLCFCCFFCKCWAVFCLDLFHIVIDIYIYCFFSIDVDFVMVFYVVFVPVVAAYIILLLCCLFLLLVYDATYGVVFIYMLFFKYCFWTYYVGVFGLHSVFCWYLLYKHGAFKYIKTTNVIKHVWWS